MEQMVTKLMLLILSFAAMSRSEVPTHMDIGVLYMQCMSGTDSVNINTEVSQYQHILLTRFQSEIALRLAISEINNKTDGIYDNLLPNTVLTSHYFPFNSSSTEGYCDGLRVSRMYPQSSIKIYAEIGPEDSEQAWGALPYSAESNIFKMGYSNMANFDAVAPYFVQSNPSLEYEGKLLAILTKHFGYQKVVVFYSTMFVESFYAFLNFRDFADKNSVEILNTIDINNVSRTTLMKFLDENSNNNVFIFFVHSFQAGPLFQIMFQEGFFRTDVQLIGSSTMISNEMWSFEGSNLTDTDIAHILTGYIGLESQCLSIDPDFSTRLFKFQSQLKSTQTVGSHCYDIFENISIYDASTANAYNSVLAVAMGLNALVTGPQACQQNNDIDHDHDFFNMLNATSNGELDISAEILHQAVLLCTPFRGSADTTTVQQVSVNVSFSVINFHKNLYLESQGANEASNERTNLHCPGARLRGMSTIGVVDQAAMRFTTCEEYLNYVGINLSVSCGQGISFNTVDNSIPPDHYPETYQSVIERNETLLYSIIIVATLLSIICGMIIFIYRSRRIVRIAQPELVCIIFGGVLCSFIAAAIVVHHQLSCYYLQWVFSAMFTLTIVPLCVSVWRMHVVLTSDRKRGNKVSVAQAIRVVLLIVAMKVFILVCYTWRGLAYGETMLKTGVDESSGEYEYCSFRMSKDRDSLFNLLGAVNNASNGVVFFLGLCFSYSTKSTPIAENLANRTLMALWVIFWNIISFILLDYFLDSGFISVYIYRMFIIIQLIVFGCHLQYVLFKQMLAFIVQGYDLNRKFVRVRIDDGFSFSACMNGFRKRRPGGLLQLEKGNMRKKERYIETGIEIKSRVHSEPPSAGERAKSMENNSISLGRDHSGFVRVVNALDLDERYQIQLQLQTLYARLDVLARRADNPSYASQAWRDDNDSDDDIDDEILDDDVESYVRRDSEPSSGQQSSIKHPVSKNYTLGSRGGKMASVVEEGSFEDAGSGSSGQGNHRYISRIHSTE